MTPARLPTPLQITKGATFRQLFFLLQPSVWVLQVQDVSLDGLLIVPAHGLTTGQPFWLEGLKYSPKALRKYGGPPMYADVVDVNTLRVPGVDRRETSGEVLRQIPVDLSNATPEFEIVDGDGKLLLLGAVEKLDGGKVQVVLSEEATAAATWEYGEFRLWVTMANGDRDAWLGGKVILRKLFV